MLLPGLIITLFLLWQRDWHVLKRMHLVSGTLLCAAVVVPWYAVMYSLHGSDFINTFFGTHNFLRATVSEHPRDDVIYYYTLVNLLALFPWSGLVPRAAYKWWRQGHRSWKNSKNFYCCGHLLFSFSFNVWQRNTSPILIRCSSRPAFCWEACWRNIRTVWMAII